MKNTCNLKISSKISYHIIWKIKSKMQRVFLKKKVFAMRKTNTQTLTIFAEFLFALSTRPTRNLFLKRDYIRSQNN